MHQLDIVPDVFGERSERAALLKGAMKAMGEAGTGVIVAINRASATPFSEALNRRTGRTAPADMDAQRDYGAGAQILSALGVHDMILLTNARHAMVALEGYGLRIVEERAIDAGATSSGLAP